MTQRLSKMQKLVRYREFQESLAANAMHQRLEETTQASEAHDQALGDVEQAGVWKARIVNDGNIDIGLYGYALGNEQRAVERCDAAKSDLDASQQRAGEAKDAWLDATSATRVSRERETAEGRRVAASEEMRTYDQLGDLLLSKQVLKHD